MPIRCKSINQLRTIWNAKNESTGYGSRERRHIQFGGGMMMMMMMITQIFINKWEMMKFYRKSNGVAYLWLACRRRRNRSEKRPPSTVPNLPLHQTQFKEMKSIRKICNRIFSIYKIINQIHPFLKTKTTKTISDWRLTRYLYISHRNITSPTIKTISFFSFFFKKEFL
jgi:hypothetical protein